MFFRCFFIAPKLLIESIVVANPPAVSPTVSNVDFNCPTCNASSPKFNLSISKTFVLSAFALSLSVLIPLSKEEKPLKLLL